MTAISSHSCGSMTNQTVSTAKATSAPRLSTFLPGSISGLDLIRADSLRNATIEPVKVTAPMKTPMNTSARVDAEQVLDARARRPRRRQVSPRRAGSRSSRPAPRPDRRSSAAARSARACRSSPRPGPATARSRHRPPSRATSSASAGAARCRGRSPARSWRPGRRAMPAMPKVLPGLAVSCWDSPARARMNSRAATMYAAWRRSRRSRCHSLSVSTHSDRENMASMRRVTAKPPKTLMVASRIATNGQRR